MKKDLKFMVNIDNNFEAEQGYNNEYREYKFKDGEPCNHPGCLNHRTHPCEGCGRIAGFREFYGIESNITEVM